MSQNTHLTVLRSLILSMKESDLVVGRLSQVDGASKARPLVLLRQLPRHERLLEKLSAYLLRKVSSQKK